MRVGHIEGRGEVYDDNGRPVLQPLESLLRQVSDDNVDVSEGSNIWNMKTIFDSTAEKGTLFLTNQRIIFIRKPDPFLAAKDNAYPLGMPDALADAWKAQTLKRLHAYGFCEILLSDIEGFWVKKRTYGVLFLKSHSKGTRKAVLYQRGKADDKFVVLRQLLTPLLGVTEPEDKKGNFLLGAKYPFLSKRR